MELYTEARKMLTNRVRNQRHINAITLDNTIRDLQIGITLETSLNTLCNKLVEMDKHFSSRKNDPDYELGSDADKKY